MKLQNKVAVVTGGNSGIGLATAREFRANGAKVVIFGRNRKTLQEATASLGGDTLAVLGDVRNLGDIDRLFEEVAIRYGKIDVLVANAGIAKFAPVESLSEALFDELSGILFKGAFYTVQKALPHLRDGSSIILVGSADADKQGRMGTSIYTAAKAAVRSLARFYVGRAPATAYSRERAQPRHDGDTDHHTRRRATGNVARSTGRHDHSYHSAEAARYAGGDGQSRAFPGFR
jgi:NAD(P)-dependent dehydrogenase (short-subunit alcohol dehydrogenase family)